MSAVIPMTPAAPTGTVLTATAPTATTPTATTPTVNEPMEVVSTATVSTATPVLSRLPLSPQRHLSLRESRALVERDDLGKWDITVPRRELTLKNGDLEFPLAIGHLNGNDLNGNDLNGHGLNDGDAHMTSERLSPSPYALGQICARLGIPVTYLRQCPLILQDQNVNFWLRHGGLQRSSLQRRGSVQHDTVSEGQGEPGCSDLNGQGRRPASEERWLLRARHGTLRAALSQHYSPLDNAALLDTLAPILPPHYQVQWLGLGDESFHLRIIDPTRSHAVLPGDDFFVGVHLSNSEVGARSLTVDALVYRLVCSNGLVALVKGKSLLRQRHIHVAAPRFRAALEEALSQALGATETMLFQLQAATRQSVPDANVAIERLARHWHLSETTEEVAKAALHREAAPVQTSAYGLLNAFTAAAQTLEGDQRYELELRAGGLAQHGVPRFALSPREEEFTPQKGEEGEDMVAYARELFGARVMRRGRSQRQEQTAIVGGEA